jgi:Zn ribbon nucleic-acid-binding protein
MIETIRKCPKCNHIGRLQIFPGEIRVRAVKCESCNYQSAKAIGDQEAVKLWNRGIE